MTAPLRPLAALLAALAVGAAAAPRTPDVAEVERLIVQRTNTLRQDEGRAALGPDPQLAGAARDLAAHMARTDRYGHEADGRTPAQRASAQGYAHCLIAENIAYQFHSAGFETQALADGFVLGWRDSPPHRENLLDPDVSHTGVAVARSARSGRYYAVQVFGRPSSDAFEFRLANRAGTTVHYEVDGERFELEPRTTMTHTQCRTPRLVLRLPGATEPTTLRPRADEHWIVERVGSNRYRVAKG